MTAKVKIPKGWKRLRCGTVIRDGDKHFNEWTLRFQPSFFIGKKLDRFINKFLGPYIRRKRPAAPSRGVRKGKGL